MQKLSYLALSLALVASASAQVPTLRYVKTVVSTGNLLTGTGISAVAVDGENMFFTGYRSSASGEVNLVKVSNWLVPNSAQTAIANDPDSAANRDCEIVLANNNIYWATSMGDQSSSTLGCNIYYLDYNGSIPVDATGNFADGVMQFGGGELPSGSWQGFDYDPGFAGTGTPHLGGILYGSTIVRRFGLSSGQISVTEGFISHTIAPASTAVRDILFDETGEAFWRVRNEIATSERTSVGGPFNTGGFNSMNVLPGTTLPISDNQFQNICLVPEGADSGAFLIANDYSVGSTSGSMKFFELSGGAPFLNLTGSPSNPFTTRVVNAAYADVNDTRYIFISGFNSLYNGVDVYQITNKWKVRGTLTLGDWVPADSGYRVPVTIDVWSADGLTLLDQHVVLATDGATPYEFYSTARGDVMFSLSAPGWLSRAVSGTITEVDMVVDASFLNGDIDADNEVGPGDFSALTGNFGASWDGIETFSSWIEGPIGGSDIDGDGEVGPSDFSILAANFGESGE